VNCDAAFRIYLTLAETDCGSVSFTNRSQTHDDAQTVIDNTTLIWVSDQTRIAHCGTFERILVRECGAKQLVSIRRNLTIYKSTYALRVKVENPGEIVVATRKIVPDLREFTVDFCFVHTHNLIDRAGGS
jgi:uncharacterized protein YcsI (UPF0317 family)